VGMSNPIGPTKRKQLPLGSLFFRFKVLLDMTTGSKPEQCEGSRGE